jgi:predicted RNase H-like HicB family nuclease
MKLKYLVKITKTPDSDWGASAPDLPGCVAVAKTLDGALRRIRGAIELHLDGMREDGAKPPRPRHRSVVPRSARGEVDFYARVNVDVRVA